MAYGQGVSSTSIQLAAAINVIANDGTYVAPKLVRSTVGPDGTVTDTLPSATREVVVEATAEEMQQLMKRVVCEGTGERAQVKDFDVAGKTGTGFKAQPDGTYFDAAGNRVYYSSFVGFFPAEDPQVTVLISIDEPPAGTDDRFGGTAAAPVFGELAPDDRARARDRAHHRRRRLRSGVSDERRRRRGRTRCRRGRRPRRTCPGRSARARSSATRRRRVTGVTHDSRAVAPGVLFACVVGDASRRPRVRGRRRSRPARQRCSSSASCPFAVTQVVVDDTRAVLGHVAAAFHGEPEPCAHDGRHHRHQRQDDDRATSIAAALRSARPRRRRDRHVERRPHHSRGDRAAGTARRDA